MLDKKEKVKNLLKDFCLVNEKTVESSSLDILGWSENPLNPDLMSYCFKNILGFKVSFRIFEKINYIIDFDYKGTHGYVKHTKLSYKFHIDKNYKNEVLGIFSTVKEILEEYFLDCAKISLNKNNFTMENEYFGYREKFMFYDKRIEELNDKLIDIEKEKNLILEGISFEKGTMKKWSDIYNEYNHKCRKIHMEMIYSIESYIDVFYSFLEHILTLLYPFTNQFDLSTSYFEKYIHNTRWAWDKKIKDVFSSLDMTDIIEKLREIKEIHRNRNAHGSFSRELKAYVHIEKFGRYPLYVGKEYLQGFTENFEIQLNYNRYMEYKGTFNQFFILLDKEYPIPMTFIKSDLSIPVDVSTLMEDVNNEKDAEEKADRLIYEYYNQLNMDW